MRFHRVWFGESVLRRLCSGQDVVLRLLRVVVPGHAAALVAQAVLAGQFLAGQDALVAVHEWMAWAIVGLSVAQTALSGLWIVRAGAAALPFAVLSFTVLLGEGLQLGTGYGRFPGVHVPLAFLIFGCTVWQSMVVFRSRGPALANRP